MTPFLDIPMEGLTRSIRYNLFSADFGLKEFNGINKKIVSEGIADMCMKPGR
jgi:hypothetical protein